MFPEVRQCRVEGHADFGASAVTVVDTEGDVVPDLWGIWNRGSGGRFGTDDDVWNWTVISGESS